MSKKRLALSEINSLDLKLVAINGLNIDFTRQAVFELWIPDIDDKNKPIAKKILLTFRPLKSIKIDVGATPWVEFIQPIVAEQYLEEKHGGIINNEDDLNQLTHYTLTTDGGIIKIIAEFVTIEIIETLPRECPDC